VIPTTLADIPAHVIDLLGQTGSVVVNSEIEHSPHKLIMAVYERSLPHIPVLRLNCLSPFSFKNKVVVRLYDREVLKEHTV
jgi:hypothetical protein